MDRELEVTGVAADTGEVLEVEPPPRPTQLELSPPTIRRPHPIERGATPTPSISPQNAASLIPPFQAGYATDQDIQFMEVRLMRADPALAANQTLVQDMVAGFVEIADQDPLLYDEFMEDPLLAMAHSTEDYLKLSAMQDLMRRAQDDGSDSEWVGRVDAMVGAAMETYGRRFGSLMSAGAILNDQDAARGEWEANSGVMDEAQRAATVAAFQERPDLPDGRGVLSPEQVRAAGDWGKVMQDVQDVAADLRHRSGRWAMDDYGNLAVEITDRDDVVLWSNIVQLDAGTEIRNNLDALVALYQAQLGIAHKVRDPEDLPGHQTLAGLAAQTVGGTTRLLQKLPGAAPVVSSVSDTIGYLLDPVGLTTKPYAPSPIEQARRAEFNVDVKPLEVDSFRRELEYATNFAKANATPAGVIYAISQQFNANPTDATVYAAGLWNTMSVDEQERAVTAAGEVDQEELLKQFRERREQEGYVPVALEEHVLQPALHAAMVWDQVVHNIGKTIIHTLDILPGQHEGALELAVTEGFGAFTDAYQEIWSNGESIAEFTGMDPNTAAAGWVNFGASIVFDPFTYATPSSASLRKAMIKQITDPDLVENYVRTNPALLDFSRQIVDDVGRVDLIPVLITGGMSDDAVDRLLTIALQDYGVQKGAREGAEEVLGEVLGESVEAAGRANSVRNQAIEEVRQILKKELPGGGGKWIPSGPSTLQLRQGVQGFTRVFRNFDDLSKRDREVAYQLLARSTRKRSVSIGDDSFADEMLRTIQIAYGHDPERMASEIRRLYDEALRPYSGAAALEAESAALQAADEALDWIEGLKRAIPTEARAVPRLKGELKTIQRRLDDISRNLENPDLDDAARQRLVDAGVRLERGMVQRRGEIDEWAGVYDFYMEQIQSFRQEVWRAEDLQKGVRNPRNRRLLERYVHEFYDRWADELDIPIVEDATHPIFGDMPLRDWEVVLGKKEADEYIKVSGDHAKNLDPLTAGDKTRDKALRTLGVFARSETPLPVSEMELIAYNAARHREGAWGAIRSGMDNFLEWTPIKVQQRIFTTAVLTNLVTPIKTNMDEVLRFWVEVGVSDLPAVLKATVGGVPGAQVAVRKLFPTSRRGTSGAIAHPGFSENALEWVTIKKGLPGHWEAAERWVNGSLLEDPIFKEYARVLIAEGGDKEMAKAAFKEWWDTRGAFFANTTTAMGREIDHEMAFDILNESFGVMLKSSGDDAKRVAERIIKAAARGEKIDGMDDAFWELIGDVPGVEPFPKFGMGKQNRRIQERTFNALYGTTGSYRAGVFFDTFYNQAMDVYRNAPGIKALNVDELMRTGAFVDEIEAARALADGQFDPHVWSMLRHQGYHLERDLEMAAARYARNRSDDLMYQMGAVSMFGKKTQRLYPFGRAQTDFLGYWWGKAAEPLYVGSKPVQIGGRNIPLNARIANRWAKLAAQHDPEGQDPSGSPADLIRRFTFLPTQFDDGFLLDVVPSPAPIVSWMVNWLPDIAEEGNPWSEAGARLRDVFGEIHPSHQVFADYSNSDAVTGFANLINATIPTSARSLRAGLEAAIKAAMAAGNIGESDLAANATVNGLVNAMLLNQESPYMRDYAAAEFIEWTEGNRNVFDILIPGTKDAAHPEFDRQHQRAFDRAYGQDAFDYLKANVAMRNQAGSDALYVRAYMPIAESIDEWYEQGLVSEGVYDEFNLDYEAIVMFLNKQGDATVSDKRRFGDIASDVFWNLPNEIQNEFVVDHPEMVVNLVSNFEVDMDLVPQELVDNGTVASGRIVSRGEDGRDAWRRGFNGDDGAVWIKAREQEDIFYDRVGRAHQHAKNYMRDTFDLITGEEWSKVNSRSRAYDAPFSRLKGRLDPEVEAAHVRRLVDTLGVELPDDALNPDGTIAGHITLGEFIEAIREERNRLGGPTILNDVSEQKLLSLDRYANDGTVRAVEMVNDAFGWDIDVDSTRGIDYYGSQLVEDLEGDISFLDREFDFTNPTEWEDVPGWDAEEARAHYRERFRMAILLGTGGEDAFDLGDYNRDFARWFGDINYEPPDPPPPAELENAVTIDNPAQFHVVDGDTIHIYTKDDEVVPFRLIGINAPERNSEFHTDSTAGLNRIMVEALERGETITLGQFDPGRYGTTQEFRSGLGDTVTDNERVFVWLYIGDTPVYDPNQFSSLNPRGQGAGVGVPDYQGFLDREREAGD